MGRKAPLFDDSVFQSLEFKDPQIKPVYYDDTPEGLICCLRKIHADIIMPILLPLGSDFPVPSIGCLFDFQHKYYPKNFTPEECIQRDIHINAILQESSSIIVNSHSVKKDILMLYPEKYHTQEKIFNLPFAPFLLSDWLDDPPKEFRKNYALPEKFFLVSNQFWIHKDHKTAFAALSRIKGTQMGRDVHMLCTGRMEDYRAPGYVQQLIDYIMEMGIKDSVHFLGHIPKSDQINVMKKAIAVVQPTLFEGGPGGGATYDAVALGIPVLLSDIPVNLEVRGPNVFFFKAGSDEELAIKMQSVLQGNMSYPKKEELIHQGRIHIEQLGNRILETIEYAIERPLK